MASLLLTILSTIAFILTIPGVQSRELPRVNKDSFYDCRSRAEANECSPDFEDPSMLRRGCGTTCKRWKEDKAHFTEFQLHDHEEFYELSAQTASNKKEIDFDRFDGYLTVIVPVAKTCSDGSVSAKAIFESIASLKGAFKFNLEVAIFPYSHPAKNYDALDCSEFEETMAMDQKKNNYFIFEETNMDAASGDMHPVFDLFFEAMKKDLEQEQENTKDYDELEGYKRWDVSFRRGNEGAPDTFTIPPLYDFFFETTKPQDVILETQTYFIVEPDGETIYFHYDKSLVDVKDALRELTKVLSELKEEL